MAPTSGVVNKGPLVNFNGAVFATIVPALICKLAVATIPIPSPIFDISSTFDELMAKPILFAPILYRPDRFSELKYIDGLVTVPGL